MKKLSTILSALVVMLAITLVNVNSAKAQEFSGGLDLAIPNGNWSDGYGVGFGLSARYEAPIQDKLNWTASAGFVSFAGKTVTGTIFGVPYSVSNPSVTLIPVTGGIKYYFSEANAGFYGAADIGFFIANQGIGTKFGFSPGVGYKVNKLDFTFRFNAVSDINYLGLRAAYIFGK